MTSRADSTNPNQQPASSTALSFHVRMEADDATINLFCQKLGVIIKQIVETPPSQLENSPRQARPVVGPVRTSTSEQESLLDTKQVAKLLSVSKRMVTRMREAKTMPEPVRLGQCIRWPKAEILAWVEEKCPPLQEWNVIRKQAVRGLEANQTSIGQTGRIGAKP